MKMPEESGAGSERVVMTVLGPIPASEMGTTITHEHCFAEWQNSFVLPKEASRLRDIDRPVDVSMLSDLKHRPFSTTRDNLILNDEDVCIAELEYFVRAGGNSVVDPTCINIGRDPIALQRVSRATGLNIVTMTGFYVESAHPEWVAEKTAEQLAEIMIGEFRGGIDGTGVRPGAIGEIGLNGRSKESGMEKVAAMTTEEEKVLRAAAWTSLQTGLTVTIHTDPYPPHAAPPAIDLLLAEGVTPDRIVIDHLDQVNDLDLHRAVADRGVFVEYDAIGRDYYAQEFGFAHDWGHDSWRARFVKQLVDEGHGGQLLFSQDVCMKIDLRKYGGPGYAHVLDNFVPMVMELGVPSEAVHDILVTNPARAFGIEYQPKSVAHRKFRAMRPARLGHTPRFGDVYRGK
jgi:phosphotriesterase-related protein